MGLWMHFTFRGCPPGQRLALILEAPTVISGIQWCIINEQPTHLRCLLGRPGRQDSWLECFSRGRNSGAGTAGTLLSDCREGALCLGLGGAKNRSSWLGSESLVWEGSCLSRRRSIAMKRHRDQGNSYQRKLQLGLADCFRGLASDHAKKQPRWHWSSS